MRLDLDRTPGLLWHYSDAAGMAGIVRTEKLWATDTRFLNDSTELAYGLSLAVESLRKFSQLAGANDSRANTFCRSSGLF